MVGVEGFEPPTSCSQSRRATRLRYTPETSEQKGCRSTLPRLSGAPGEIRTPDHQVRSLVLYPAELRARRRRIMREVANTVNLEQSCRSVEPRVLLRPLLHRRTKKAAPRATFSVLAEREGFTRAIHGPRPSGGFAVLIGNPAELSNGVLILDLSLRQMPKRPLAGAFWHLAEREGFEPTMGVKAHTPLAGERLQPLGHLS